MHTLILWTFLFVLCSGSDRAVWSPGGLVPVDAGTPEAKDGPEGLRVVASYAMIALAPGCTPTVRKFSDGEMFWGGCPSFQCGENDECQGYEVPASEGFYALSCKCIDDVPGAVLCRGLVILSQATQQVVLWTCEKLDCATACSVASEPAGEARFAVCNCP